MLEEYFTFTRMRILALSYTAATSVLTSAIGIFALPTAGRSHAPALAVIAGVSLVVGLTTCSTLVIPKAECCRRRNTIESRRIYVGIEVISCIASMPLLVTAIALEAELAAPQAPHASSGPSRDTTHAFRRNGGQTLSALLLVFSGSTALVLLIHTCLIAGLAVYTHWRTQRTNVWFADAAAHAPAFAFPHSLGFLRALEDVPSSEIDIERARRIPRIRLEQLEANPTVIALARQVQARHRTAHTFAPDCTCGEKLPWVPAQPDEYRALSRVYARVWSIVAEQEAVERAQGLGRGLGHRQAISVPVPILRVPTERERRRTVYIVSFDAASE